MSAFAVLVHWDDSAVDPDILERSNRCVSYRCPDGSWARVIGPVGLAQADLATLPEDQPGVPISSGDLHIVADCRIDNREELWRDLPGGSGLKGRPDAETVLAAYRAWGAGCADRLIGDFAFVVWDDERKSVFAARDISGTRPLYFYRDGGKIFLASERTQILQDSRIPFEVDEDQLVEVLTPSFQFRSGWDLGLLRGFDALEPGSILLAERGRFAVKPFWSWVDRTPEQRGDEESFEAYYEVLNRAVACRLRSNGPVGIELSGGLDSSAVAALASKSGLMKGEIHTFSKLYDRHPSVDERHRIGDLLQKYPLKSHLLSSDDSFVLGYIKPDWAPRSIVGIHELLGGSMDRLFDTAHDCGCRVVLSGHFGDALNFGSDRVYYDLLKSGQFREFSQRLAIDWDRYKKQPPAKLFKIMANRLFFDGMLPFLPQGILRAGLIARDRWAGSGYEIPGYLTTRFRGRIQQRDRAIRDRRIASARVKSPAVRETLGFFPPPNIYTVPLAQPIERRHPYADRRLIEMVMTMPQHLKWEHGRPIRFSACRMHHRRAMIGTLPDSILMQPGTITFESVLMDCYSPAEARGWLLGGDTVHLFERGIVDREAFLDAINSTEEPHYYMVSLLAIEAWLRACDIGGRMSNLVPERARICRSHAADRATMGLA